MQIYEKFKNYETFLASFTYDIIKQRRKANRIGNIQIPMYVLLEEKLIKILEMFTNSLTLQQ